MITTLRLYILTCVVLSADDTYIEQLAPIAFNNIEDARNFVKIDGSILFEHIDNTFIIWHTMYEGKKLYYTLWF